MGTANEFLDKIKGQVGYVEYTKRFGNMRRSNGTIYGEQLGINFQPWCATFMTWGLLPSIDLRKISDNPYYTPNLNNDMKAKGMGVSRANAKPGDLVFFDFPDGVHRIQHVESITKIEPNGFQSCGGNTSSANESNGGMVMLRGRNWNSVVSVCRPPFVFSQPTPPPVQQKPAETQTEKFFRELAFALEYSRGQIIGDGHKNENGPVQFVQAGLNSKKMVNFQGQPLFTAQDGVWGPKTKGLVIWFQAMMGLAADGVVGPGTWAALYPR